jgi:hypothetical protein
VCSAVVGGRQTRVDKMGEWPMNQFDSFPASLTSAMRTDQASPEGQTKDYENVMLTFSLEEPVEPLAQATFRAIARCQ